MTLFAAIVSSCSRLLTEELQHGAVFDGVTVENPFITAPLTPADG